MKFGTLAATAALVFGANIALAQTGDPITIATESGVCGDAAVIAAVFTESGSISATCDDATGFVPLVAGPLAALLGVGLLAASGGGNGPGSTSGTN